MVVTNYSYVLENKNNKVVPLRRPQGIEYGRTYSAEEIDFSNLGCPHLLWMHADTFKLEVIRKAGTRFLTGISYTDMQYVMYPLSVAKTIVFLDMFLYMYTVGREGQTCDPKVHLKSLNDHYKISKKVLDDYIEMYKGKGISVTRKNVAGVVRTVLGGYFSHFLCSMNGTDDEEKRAHELYDKMKTGAPEILEGLRGIKYERLIPYFRIWERTGKHLTDFPYNILKPIAKATRNILRCGKHLLCSFLRIKR